MVNNRPLVFALTFFGYASIHILRQGWSYSKSQLQEEYGIPKRTIGWVDATFLFCYTTGMAVLGTLNHLLPLKVYVLIGLTVCSLSYMSWSVIFYFSGAQKPSVPFIFIAMAVNGFFQATGRPGMIAIMGNWFSKQKKSLLMGLWAMNANCGNVLALVVCNILEKASFSWIINFIVTGCFALLVVGLATLLLSDRPPEEKQFQASLLEQEGAEQSSQEENGEIKEITKEKDQKVSSGQQQDLDDFMAPTEDELNNSRIDNFKYGVFSAFCLPKIPLYVVSYACLKGVIYGLLFWLPTFCDDKQGAIEEQKGFIAAMLDVGCLFSGGIVGYLADKYQLRVIFLCPMLLVCSICMFLISFVLTDVVWTYYLMILLVGLFIGGPYNLIGTVIAIEAGHQLNDKGSVAKISSLIEGSAALLTAVQMIAIPYIGLGSVFYLFSSLGFIAFVMLIPFFVEELKTVRNRENSLLPKQLSQ